MDNTLERLVDRIYQEGVSKAEGKAAEILAKAEEQARERLKAAEHEAAQITARANSEAAQISQNMQSELRLAAARTLSDLKRAISTLLAERVIKEPLQGAFNDENFVRELVTGLTAHAGDREIVISGSEPAIESLRQKLVIAMQAKLPALVVQGGGKSQGFSVAVKGNGFEIQFDEAAVWDFLNPHLRESTRLLFKSENDR